MKTVTPVSVQSIGTMNPGRRTVFPFQSVRTPVESGCRSARSRASWGTNSSSSNGRAREPSGSRSLHSRSITDSACSVRPNVAAAAKPRRKQRRLICPSIIFRLLFANPNPFTAIQVRRRIIAYGYTDRILKVGLVWVKRDAGQGHFPFISSPSCRPQGKAGMP